LNSNNLKMNMDLFLLMETSLKVARLIIHLQLQSRTHSRNTLILWLNQPAYKSKNTKRIHLQFYITNTIRNNNRWYCLYVHINAIIADLNKLRLLLILCRYSKNTLNTQKHLKHLYNNRSKSKSKYRKYLINKLIVDLNMQ
jgi:hypothetical protein